MLPPDDPKAHALEQSANPTMLRQLVESNFSRKGMLLPERDIQSTFTDLAKIVKDTITMANNFSSEPTPQGPFSIAERYEEMSQACVKSHTSEQEVVAEGTHASKPSVDLQSTGQAHHSLMKCEWIDSNFCVFLS